ncbi:type I DNA topoisomerase [Sphingomonadales bacterium 56]|uniref:type I DNA topoisomerase n=1 Tax=unclassified Sphingobium TaxID=2611147 RepID=UPI00191A5E77|nr:MULTISPECIES: type I DNA topoisomerase [unclassified Sphingobium]MBY2927630.1 type I DNA topoisomerase [Sphingomonadales bacterium 56]MBY2957730.1 type I DNA topoisomerase [Sphingomonadales bacterium 58]CAD7335616.1 DNA topoisomerase 1 [Sphingobium sp. S6]CAD7335681.1 DNA topoisomerase 1 [Sphingobium sp. S8]
MQLVIVESPAKAKTIEKYLGGDFHVLASYGHIRDLPPKDGSVDPDNGFAMQWENYGDKGKQLKAIADEAKKADRLILATDPDREGEAISWHVQEVLRAKKALPQKVDRVTFNAITKQAVTEAMAQPRALDEDLIDAYRARRALDYLVGFTLSPVLWRKLPGAKSAGRVQSVALRLVVDREREIESFVPQEYWSVAAEMEQGGQGFTARLVRWKGEKIDRLTIGKEGDAMAAKADVEAGRFTVEKVETKPVSRNPPPPFTTSTLQQEAARKLGFSASHTMRIAQQLYEDGAITYMRTDGVQMDGSAISAARRAIAERYDGGYLPEKPRQYQTKAKNAQEAHEAIRPTEFSRDKVGSGDHARLYDLIFKRALASQMASARLERTVIDLVDGTGQHALRATGQVVIFPGFLALYEEGRDDAEDDDSKLLPRLVAGDAPAKRQVTAEQHFTQPPPRYSEASLVKKLEELGIGRPSTYASTLQVLKDRDYVRVEKNRFFAEESGRLVTAFLERFFERYVSYDFTAGLEDELDEISGGRAQWQAVLEAFWRDFKPKTAEVMEQKPSDITAELDKFLEPMLFPPKADGSNPRACPMCGDGQLALRGGRFGAFIACSNYPECKYTRKFGQPGASDGGEDKGPEVLGQHPETGQDIVRKSGRFGPYMEMGEGKEAKRGSIPKDLPDGELTLDWAVKLLSLPREVGLHPETGKPIVANIGRFGPYLLHDGKYGRLSSTAEIFEVGMNSAVAKLADAVNKGPRGGASREPLKLLGKHPRTEAEIKLMAGRYGPYVTDGTTNATLPKTIEQDALTLEEAAQLIDARAAAAPAKKGKKKAPKKAAAKKDGAAKKPAAKKAPAKKKAAASE